MSWRLGREPGEEDRGRHARIRPALAPRFDHENYVASDAVIEAVNTAISLGKPLLDRKSVV